MKARVSRTITHRFGLDESEVVYDVFWRASESGALMGLLTTK